MPLLMELLSQHITSNSLISIDIEICMLTNNNVAQHRVNTKAQKLLLTRADPSSRVYQPSRNGGLLYRESYLTNRAELHHRGGQYEDSQW